ncbi:MAG: serine/threonine-protein kinase, partial [Nannocystaceae bacterium]
MHHQLEKIITDHAPTGEHHVQSVRERLFGPSRPGPSPSPGPGSIGRVRERLFGVPRRLLPAPYEPRGLIGEGAFGQVHRALDTKHDRYVALKIVGYASAEQEARIKREAQAVAAISHPNVVVIYDHGRVDADRYFIALEYVPGTRLDTWLQEGERSLPEILRVFLQTARGLRAVHEGKIVHRDFKPTNVIVGDDGRVRVLDFGLAKRLGRISEEDLEVAAVSDATITAADSGLLTRSTDRCDGEDSRAAHSAHPSCPAVRQSAEPIRGRGRGQRCGEQYLDITLSRDGRFAGSVVYASPEQLTGQPVDTRGDIFSYCVALFEAVYGFRPFPGTSRTELATRIAIGEIAV